MRLEWKPENNSSLNESASVGIHDSNNNNNNNSTNNNSTNNSSTNNSNTNNSSTNSNTNSKNTNNSANGNANNHNNSNMQTPPSSEEYMAPVTDMTGEHERVLNPMAGMSTAEKIKYLFTYYGLKTFAIIALVAVTIALIVNYVTHREAAVRLILLNHIVETEEQADELKESFNEYLLSNGYKEKDFVEINSEVRYSLNDKNTDYLDVQSLMTLIATKKYSGFFSDEYMFTFYGNSEYFRDVTLLLTYEQYKSFEENGDIIYGKKYEDGSEYPCGIRLTPENCNWLSHTSYETCCYGVLFGNMSNEEAYNLTQYILSYNN